MKNKLTDLNNHLFAEIERLGDEDLAGEELLEEIERAKAIEKIGGTIISNASLVLKAEIAKNEYCGKKIQMPGFLLEDKEKKND